MQLFKRVLRIKAIQISGLFASFMSICFECIAADAKAAIGNGAAHLVHCGATAVLMQVSDRRRIQGEAAPAADSRSADLNSFGGASAITSRISGVNKYL